MTTTKQVKPVWKCKVEGCNYTAGPTMEGYKKVCGHQLGHVSVPKAKRGAHLVDENTGQILAEKLDEATGKGFIPPKVPEAEPSEAAPKQEPEQESTPESDLPPELEEQETKQVGKEGKKEITEPQVSSEGIFRYTISLPADAFTLFHLAKFSGLEKDREKPFDEWLWDAIVARFKYEYKRQLVLAPMEE